MKFLLVLALLVSGFSNANGASNPSHPFIDECGETSTAVLPFVLAANSADQALCLNSLTGNLDSDLKVVRECFLGRRIVKLTKNNFNYSRKKECTDRFVKLCAEVRKCEGEESKDKIFGGKKLFCGHAGNFLDIYWRVRGGFRDAFTQEDAVNLCTKLAQINRPELP